MIDLTEMDNRLAEHLTRIKRVDRGNVDAGGDAGAPRAEREWPLSGRFGSRSVAGRRPRRAAHLRVVPAGFHRYARLQGAVAHPADGA